ncbi:MAG: hypothetical protein HY445_00700 [Candidatus Niyogibacteria bacterium]|nr:hypothetical protein [Candidatus Niyogibacteria bacterium]
MKRIVKKYFIAHKDNDHKPHILHGKAIAVMIGIVLLLFFYAIIQHAIVTGTNFAAVISSVLVDLANGDRESNSIRTLTINPVLAEAAQLKANDMVLKNYFAHTSPDGITPWHWFREAGYDFLYAGENLAVNFSDSIDVERAWMNSPLHRENILGKNFSEIGIATAQGLYKGRPTTFVVQFFGSPLPKEIIEAKKEIKKEEAKSIAIAEEQKTNVLGSSASEELFDIVESSETFAAVDLNGEPLSDVMNTVKENMPSPPAGGYASFFDTITTAPKRIVYAVYGIIALLVAFALSSYFVIEIKRRHMRHIAYGAGTLMFITLLFFFSRIFIYAKVFVQ